MAPAPREPDFRESTRMPLKASVRLQFGATEELTASTANISIGGFFVAYRPPKPVGTLVRFEIDLPGLADPISGYGEVAWIRVREEGKSQPVGMGVRFRHLPEPGPDLLRGELARSQDFLELAAASGVTDEEPEEQGERPIESWRISYPKPVAGLDDEAPSWQEEGEAGAAEQGPAPEASSWNGAEAPEAPAAAADLEVEPSPPIRRRKTLTRPALLALAGVAVALLAGGLFVGRGLLGAGGGGDRGGAFQAPGAGEGQPGAEAPAPAQPAGEAEPPAAGPPPTTPSAAIRDITWASVPGETIVVVSGDGTLAAQRVSHQRLGGGPPRELVKIAGIAIPYRYAEMAVDTPELRRIRTGHHPESGEIYVVLDLPGERFGIDRLEHEPSRVRVYLRARRDG
jgi:uncharacterized protein (TIGR02266 family)